MQYLKISEVSEGQKPEDLTRALAMVLGQTLVDDALDEDGVCVVIRAIAEVNWPKAPEAAPEDLEAGKVAE